MGDVEHASLGNDRAITRHPRLNSAYLLSASAVALVRVRQPGASSRPSPAAPPWEPAASMSWIRQAALSTDPGKIRYLDRA